MPQPRLYGEFASWFHALTHPDNYVEEAAVFRRVFEAHSRPVRTILELGSGGGNNASHMKSAFEMTLTDLSPEMLEVSKGLNPECEHIQGDMRTLRLGRTFDAVFVHDAVAYLTSEPDLEAAMRTAWAHLVPGGLALFVPDETEESYRPRASVGGDDVGSRSMRYREWDEPREPGETIVRTRFVYEMREGDEVRTETDVHEVGVFPRSVWLSLLDRVGFEAKAERYEHSEFPPDSNYELFLGVRPITT